METKVLKIVYTFFLGVMLALFVGLGTDTFYPPPAQPSNVSVSSKPTAEEEATMQRAWEDYQKAMEPYNRNVSIIAASSAVLLFGASLLLERRTNVLANGLMLGGLFTLVYGVGRGFASGDSRTTFITVAVGLAVVIFLGYRRFAGRGAKPGAAPPAAVA